MKRESFFSSVVADTFFVSKAENIRIDHYKEDLGFFIFWEYAGTHCKYIKTSNIGDIAEVMKHWFPENSDTAIGWAHIYNKCCKLESQYKKAGL